MLVGLDFETYGSVNLPQHGLDRYVRDPHFRPLIGVMYYEQRGRHLYRQYDFVDNWHVALHDLKQDCKEVKIAAHNIGFEIEVLKHLGIHLQEEQIVDSAVVGRIAGATSHLASAAPQLLGAAKMEEGRDLIKLFSIPGKYQEKNGNDSFDAEITVDYPNEWKMFMQYCGKDAQLCYKIASQYGREMSTIEQQYQVITLAMNMRGWHVDVPMVQEMHRRYLENLEETEHDFVTRYGELNFGSLKQMKEFCADRGVKATSFDQKHVTSMLKKLDAKLESIREGEQKWFDYFEVQQMLITKQILGGSALKKLQVILDTVGPDGRLRDQYLHCGAGQTLRTTGRSTQMQNLKRLGDSKIDDMNWLFDDAQKFDNDELAENMRQLFTSSDPNGLLVVGDFAAVESMGLGWLAGEDWKTDAYRKKQDLYKILAGTIYGVHPSDVTKEQRQIGKVGELSCGYGAGSGAVMEFAKNMGVTLTEGEAHKLVIDWRAANPKIVDFWDTLSVMLEDAFRGRQGQLLPFNELKLADGFTLRISSGSSPESLNKQHGAELPALIVEVMGPKQTVFLRRKFLGCHRRGRNIGYYKPTARKTGDLWSNHFTDPKTKQVRFYELYGGKLSGILTQSFCRELFFQSLKRVDDWCRRFDNVDLIGQFHDEIVLDWRPNGVALEIVEAKLEEFMSDPGLVKSFPLRAEVKHDYRYTK